MTVKGFELPVAFVELCDAIGRGEAPEEWGLKQNVDAYGDLWENYGLSLATTPETIAQATRHLKQMFQGNRFQQDEAFRDQPGFIQDFAGIADYLQIGAGETGEPYCLDFGGNSKEPSVVAWPALDCYWRRVAPSFETFIALFVDSSDSQLWLADDEEVEVVQPTPRLLLAAWAKSYVMAPPDLRCFAHLPEGDYAACTEAERREVEAEVRAALEREGLTDEQQLRLDRMWARLRATDAA